MARALRIQPPSGRYHVTARGNEPRAIYGEASDRAHLFQVHAYVLMDNHFHVLVETPEPNLSRAMQ